MDTIDRSKSKAVAISDTIINKTKVTKVSGRTCRLIYDTKTLVIENAYKDEDGILETLIDGTNRGFAFFDKCEDAEAFIKDNRLTYPVDDDGLNQWDTNPYAEEFETK